MGLNSMDIETSASNLGRQRTKKPECNLETLEGILAFSRKRRGANTPEDGGPPHIGQQIAIRQNIRDFIAETRLINFVVPLEKLKKLGGFNGDTLRKILGRMKLRPVPLRHKLAELF
jgi:hypothetical protein